MSTGDDSGEGRPDHGPRCPDETTLPDSDADETGEPLRQQNVIVWFGILFLAIWAIMHSLALLATL